MAEGVKAMNEYHGGSPDLLRAVERWENEGGRFELANFTPHRGAGNNAPAPASRRRANEDEVRIEVKRDDDRGRNRISEARRSRGRGRGQA
jgi:hypothetical protein